MKKTAVLAIVVATCPTMCFAYSSYSHYSEPELIPTWLAIVIVVWGTLNLILFFKIWGMTNNVEKMLQIVRDSAPTPEFQEGEELMCKGMEYPIVVVLKKNEDGTYHCKELYGEKKEKDFKPCDLHRKID